MKTNDEIRRANLGIAIERVGTAARLADLSGTAPAYLSQIKNASPDSKSGTPKTMGDDMARRIEEAIGEGSGWMDADHGAPDQEDAAKDAMLAAARPAHVQWVGDDEAEILDAYRTTDLEGRLKIKTMAKSVSRLALRSIANDKQ